MIVPQKKLGTKVSRGSRPAAPGVTPPVTSAAPPVAAPACVRGAPGSPLGRRTMRRYHFDLVDTNAVTDAGGSLLDDDQARKVARHLVHEVREMRPELIGRGY